MVMRASEWRDQLDTLIRDHANPVIAIQTQDGLADIKGWAMNHGQAVLQVSERPF